MPMTSTISRPKKEQEWMLKALLSSIPSGAIGTDIQGVITLINPAAESLTGVLSTEAIGKSLAQCLTMIDRKSNQAISLHPKSLSEFDREPQDLTLLNCDRQEIPICVKVTPIQNDRAVTVGFVIILDRKEPQLEKHRSKEVELQRLNLELETRVQQRTEDFLAVNNQLVIALEERGRIETKLRRHLDRLELTYKMAFNLNQSTSLEQVYRIAITSIKKIFQADRSSIIIQDEAGHSRFQMADGISQNFQKIIEEFIQQDACNQSSEPKIIPDIEQYPGVESIRESIRAEGFRSLGNFTLSHQNRTMGEITICYDRPHDFSDEEIQLGKAIATYVGMAVSRKQVKDALKESEAKYRVLFNAIEDSVFVHQQGANPNFVAVNDAACRSLGYSRDQLLAMSPRDIIPKHFQTDCPKTAKSSDGNHFVFEVIHIRKDGTQFPVEVAGMAFEMKGEKMIMGIARNISDRKQAQEKLLKSEAALAEAQKIARMGNWECDITTGQVTWSEQLFDIWGFSPDHPEPQSSEILERIVAEDRLRLTRLRDEAIAKNLPFEIDFKVHLPDGTSKWLFTRGHNLLDQSGKPVKSYGITQDITERKQAEELSLELEREKEINELRIRFFSMMSHEFRTPLSVIINASHLLKLTNNQLENKSIQKQVGYIESSTKRLVSIMDNVLTINRAEVGKLEFNPQPIQVDQYCRQLVTEMVLSIGNQQRIHYLSLCQLQKVKLDRKLLDSILTNLLSNALKYSPQSSTVTLELNCQTVSPDPQPHQPLNSKKSKTQNQTLTKSYVIFQVSDHGIGISKADLQHIFDPFYRAKNAEKKEGTGLGLSIVKQYVKAHGGTISVKSEIGVGTTFTVTLPIST
jgi:PAS domain S-box-containing protein